MTERPILMSAPMVRAILAGAKTQTRRVVKPRKDRDLGCELAACELAGEVNGGEYRNAYCAPGDRLWVREAWRAYAAFNKTPPRDITPEAPIWYEAQDEVPFHPTAYGKLRPSMFMPRWASRITLEVTGVRVERLQDISVADALAEGVNVHPCHHSKPRDSIYSPVQAYRELWESINGPGSWDANPWVWCVEFRRIDAAMGPQFRTIARAVIDADRAPETVLLHAGAGRCAQRTCELTRKT